MNIEYTHVGSLNMAKLNEPVLADIAVTIDGIGANGHHVDVRISSKNAGILVRKYDKCCIDISGN